MRATGDISDRFQLILGEYQPTGEYSLLEDVNGPGSRELRQDPDAQANWLEAPKYRKNVPGTFMGYIQLTLEYGELAPNGQYWGLSIDPGRSAFTYEKSACPVDTTDWRMRDVQVSPVDDYSANITISCK